MDKNPTLRCLYAHAPMNNNTITPLRRLSSLVGPCKDSLQFLEVNIRQHLDLDVVYFMMLIKKLSDLFGIMTRLANRKMKVKVSLSDLLP